MIPRLINRSQSETSTGRKSGSGAVATSSGETSGFGTSDFGSSDIRSPAEAPRYSGESIHDALAKEGQAGARGDQQRSQNLGKQAHRVGIGVPVSRHGDEHQA